MDSVQELFAVAVPLVVALVGLASLRAWRRERPRRPLQLAGAVLAVAYGPITIANLALRGNACGDFLFADIGYAPRSATVDVLGKACLLVAALLWGLDGARRRDASPTT